ncbi:MAG: phosphonate C-P lyase system protein PhnH [Hyphomicrobiaceae bacterium]|nr:phosphonate C-P lyase system protein PhnH [Hyphomicrobiaceae bacterium]
MRQDPSPDSGAIWPGFSAPALQSQSAFRTVMLALSEPGKVREATERVNAPDPLNPVAAMVLLTLCDVDTSVWLDAEMRAHRELSDFIRFHTGSTIVESPSRAQFAFVSSSRRVPDLKNFAQGSDSYPDRSTTLIVQTEALTNDAGTLLQGPGIETSIRLGIAPLSDTFWDCVRSNHRQFPRGVDVIFCTNTHLAGLPRSTRLASGA